MKSLTGEKIMSESKGEWIGEKEFTGENFREKEARRETKGIEIWKCRKKESIRTEKAIHIWQNNSYNRTS